jgi:hypothetical protein
MAEALVRRGRAADEDGWEIEMTALRRLGREEVHMMNPFAQQGAARPGNLRLHLIRCQAK